MSRKRSDDYEIVRHIKPRTHFCKLPGWWRRKRDKMAVGTIVKCVECSQRWVWSRGAYGLPDAWRQMS